MAKTRASVQNLILPFTSSTNNKNKKKITQRKSIVRKKLPPRQQTRREQTIQTVNAVAPSMSHSSTSQPVVPVSQNLPLNYLYSQPLYNPNLQIMPHLLQQQQQYEPNSVHNISSVPPQNPVTTQQPHSNSLASSSPNENLEAIPSTGNPFWKIVNLLPYFESHRKGGVILNAIRNETSEIPITTIYEIVSVTFDLLLSRVDSLKFGRFKKELLHNMAESIVKTFPRLADPIGVNENPQLKHVCQNFLLLF